MWSKYENISDELLAAFLDGNTTKEETEQILGAMTFDENLMEVFDVVESIDNFEEGDSTNNILPIAPITIGGLGIIGGGIGEQLLHNDIRLVAANNIDIEEIDKTDNNMANLKIETIGDINTVEYAHSHSYYEANKTYGLEAKNITFDPNVFQYESDTCAIRSQEIVLRDYGIFVPQEDLKNIAAQHGWYSKGGTPFEAVGNLLDYHNIPNHREYNANIFNITDELAQGHRVIVGVDANELSGNSFWETIKEFFLGENANHALIVSGLDTSDPNNIKVILTDPGTGKTLFECPQDRFIAAWEDSKCFMVATDQPAPLAYNGETMVGFDYSKGHIAAIGNIDYDHFHNEIVPNADKYLPYLNSLDEYINNLEMNIATDWEHPELYNQLDDLTNSVHNEFVKLKMQELAGIAMDNPDDPDDANESTDTYGENDDYDLFDDFINV